MKRNQWLKAGTAACLTAVMMFGATVYGSENFNETGYPIVNEPVTVSLMGSKHPIQGEWSTLKFFQIMEEKTGISFTFDTPSLDVMEEKKSLAITGGAYPEVFFGANLTTAQQVKWGMEEGILIPLNDLIDQYAPNIKAMFEAIPGMEASITAPDGNIYALPQMSESPYACYIPAYYNGAWLEALGVTEEELPTTLEEFYDLMVRFRDEDPNGNGEADEIPIAIALAQGTTVGADIPDLYLLPTFGVNSSKIYAEDGVVKYGAQQENYKEYLKFLHKLYEEKLLDNEYITSDSVTVTAQGKANQVGVAVTAGPINTWEVTVEDALKYPLVGALSGEYTDGKQICVYSNSPITQGTFAITDICEHPEAMIRWVDYLYSEEGSILIHFGEENDLWEFAESGYRRYIQPDGMSTEEYRGGYVTPDCGSACPKWVRKETEINWDDEFQRTAMENIYKRVQPYTVQDFPNTYFSAEDTERIGVITTDLDKYLEETVAGFVVGSIDIDAGWDEFQATLKQMSVEELVSLYQKSYDIWAEN